MMKWVTQRQILLFIVVLYQRVRAMSIIYVLPRCCVGVILLSFR